jgi:hypothetical protein
MPLCVIPAEAGIQEYQELLDPVFQRGDGFLDNYQFCFEKLELCIGPRSARYDPQR